MKKKVLRVLHNRVSSKCLPDSGIMFTYVDTFVKETSDSQTE